MPRDQPNEGVKSWKVFAHPTGPRSCLTVQATVGGTSSPPGPPPARSGCGEVRALGAAGAGTGQRPTAPVPRVRDKHAEMLGLDGSRGHGAGPTAATNRGHAATRSTSTPRQRYIRRLVPVTTSPTIGRVRPFLAACAQGTPSGVRSFSRTNPVRADTLRPGVLHLGRGAFSGRRPDGEVLPLRRNDPCDLPSGATRVRRPPAPRPWPVRLLVRPPCWRPNQARARRRTRSARRIPRCALTPRR
jgi:hypothetical protein